MPKSEKKLSDLNTKERAAIKKRYLGGEKPKSIASDFGLAPKQVSELANREGWKQKKQKITEENNEKIEAEVKAELGELKKLSMTAAVQLLKNLVNPGKGQGTSKNALISKDVQINPLTKTALSEGLKLWNKPQEEEPADPSAGKALGELDTSEIIHRIRKNIGK